MGHSGIDRDRLRDFDDSVFLCPLKRMDVTQAILGNYLLPFFIALMGVVLLGETITPVMCLGGGVILFSTLMLTVFERDLIELVARKPKHLAFAAGGGGHERLE